MFQGKKPCQPLPSFFQLIIPPDLEAAALKHDQNNWYKMSAQDGISHTIWLSSSYPAKLPCATLLEWERWSHTYSWRYCCDGVICLRDGAIGADRWSDGDTKMGDNYCNGSTVTQAHQLCISMPTSWWKPWKMQCSLISKTTTWMWKKNLQKSFIFLDHRFKAFSYLLYLVSWWSCHPCVLSQILITLHVLMLSARACIVI